MPDGNISSKIVSDLYHSARENEKGMNPQSFTVRLPKGYTIIGFVVFLLFGALLFLPLLAGLFCRGIPDCLTLAFFSAHIPAK